MKHPIVNQEERVFWKECKYGTGNRRFRLIVSLLFSFNVILLLLFIVMIIIIVNNVEKFRI